MKHWNLFFSKCSIQVEKQAGSMPQDVLKKREGWALGCDEFLAECEVYNSTPLLIVIRSNKMLYEMGNAFYVLPISSNEMCDFPLSAGTWWTLAGWEVVQCDSYLIVPLALFVMYFPLIVFGILPFLICMDNKHWTFAWSSNMNPGKRVETRTGSELWRCTCTTFKPRHAA